MELSKVAVLQEAFNSETYRYNVLTGNQPKSIKITTTVADTYQWKSEGLFATTTTTDPNFSFTVPETYVEDAADSEAEAVVELTVTRNVRGKQIESSVKQSLTINKRDNGKIEIARIGNLELEDALITAPPLTDAILSTDIDGKNDNPNIEYHWETTTDSNVWKETARTTINTYSVPDTIPNGTRYRASIIYTDGQGHPTTATTTEAITYIDIDRDNDGLIEITTAEQLNAIRYSLDGTSYHTVTTKTTIGCREGGCNGYELKAHINLRGYNNNNWQPIVNNGKGFNAIFDGNNYTIYNLKIVSSENNVGLFAKTETGAEIRNVGLLNVHIEGNKYVGSLVGSNSGTIIDSHAVIRFIIGTSGEDMAVGGLVGSNSSTITKSHTIIRDINGEGNNIGGLVGKTAGGVISHSYAKVDDIKIDGDSICPPGSSVDRLIKKLVGNNDTNNPTVIRESKMAGGCNSGKLFAP